MSRTASEPSQVFEECPCCGNETAHSVTIELRQESSGEDQVGHSREPYRVSRCERCGASERLRMNHQ